MIPILIAILVLLFGPLSSALADSDLRDEAARHAEAGKAASDEGNWVLAEKEYAQSLDLAKKLKPREPRIELDLVQNLSRINEKLGRFELAIQQAQLVLTDSAIDPRERDEHEGRVARMRRHLELQAPPIAPLPKPASLPQPPAKRPRFSPGAVALISVSVALLITGVACGASIPGVTSALSEPISFGDAEAIASRVRGLQGCGAAFGSAGAAGIAGGVAWLAVSLRR